jgi:hypothetical protein
MIAWFGRIAFGFGMAYFTAALISPGADTAAAMIGGGLMGFGAAFGWEDE